MIELLRTRRSIRKYTEQKIEPEKVEILKEAVLLSPSSKGINPWKFIFIEDPETIQKLKLFKPTGASPLETARLAVVFCADETVNDAWVEDCSIAAIILQLTAHSLGLGSCWIHAHYRMHSETVSSEKYIQDLLGIPAHFRVLCAVSVGYPAKSVKGRPFEELQFEKIRTNKF
ncbi:MAG: NAD(P)H-dependent dehydrogenase/reductase [Bacteroidetes bacterium]|nr:MAG: NAD(P)H-dependent dehydrogenase/reductase [Bacteroidota bacterium]